MAPSMVQVHSLVRRYEAEYAMHPFWIVLLVLLGAGFAVLAAYAIARHFFPPASEQQSTIGEDEQGMTQMQYQRQLRLRNQEQLQALYGFRDIPRQPAGSIYAGNESVMSY